MYIDLKPLLKKLSNKNNKKHSAKLGILHYGERADTTQYISSIIAKCKKLGITVIVQDLKGTLKPLGKALELQKICDAIIPIRPFPILIENVLKDTLDCYKDVDNFTNKSIFPNCTAEAVLRILKYLNIKTDKHVLVIGRHIGLEIFKTLLKNDYTVSIAHSKTQSLQVITRSADVVITCTGVKDLIKKDMVKINATVLDIGLGDVEEKVIEKANVTQVKEGVGAVTTAVLMQHVLRM